MQALNISAIEELSGFSAERRQRGSQKDRPFANRFREVATIKRRKIRASGLPQCLYLGARHKGLAATSAPAAPPDSGFEK